MKLVIVGPPGAGKGTQAKIIASKLSIAHISTGEIFLHHIRNQDALGKKVKAYYEKGNLVPDTLVHEVVKGALKNPAAKAGFMLDGYPRNLAQARFLDKEVHIDHTINIVVSDEDVIKRMTGRRLCDCGAFYNLNIPELKPKDPTKCDKCGHKLTQRPDDNERAIRERLDVYHTQVLPVVEHYRKKGLVLDVDGSGTVEEVTALIVSALEH